MTLEELEKAPREYLLAREVAPVLGMDPQSLRTAAREYPEALGFPVTVAGSRIVIPKAAFLRHMRGA